ncbi:MAG: helix-turn-helix domain-containing protein [Deinococcota bacterium]
MASPELQQKLANLPPINVLNRRCPSNDVLDMIADKWTVLVIYALRDNTWRYSDLERMIDGISQKMLTQTLRKLERNGLVVRTVYPVVPPKVEYVLTDLGSSLHEVLRPLCKWSQTHMPDILGAQEIYDNSTSS